MKQKIGTGKSDDNNWITTASEMTITRDCCNEQITDTRRMVLVLTRTDPHRFILFYFQNAHSLL